MTLPFPSLNHVHLIGKLDRPPQVELDGKRRITTLAVITMDEDADRTHRVVVYEQMLVQPIFDALVTGSIVQIIGQLDFDDKGYFVSVPPRRGCDLQLLAPALDAGAHAAAPRDNRTQPIVVPAEAQQKATESTSSQVGGAGAPVETARPAAQSTQPQSAPARTPPVSTAQVSRPAPGGRPGGLAAVASAAAPSNDDDIHDDGRDPPDSSDDAGAETPQREQPASTQVSRPGPGLAAVASAARPGSPPPRPAPGGPRPTPTAAAPINGVQRPAPPARPGAARPGTPAPVNRPTVPPDFADDIPF